MRRNLCPGTLSWPGLVCRTSELQINLQQAAIEEGDHLTWCKQSLTELGSHYELLKSPLVCWIILYRHDSGHDR